MIPWTGVSGHVGVNQFKVRIASDLRRDYIHRMADNINATFEHELKRLEKRVDALVRVCDQLQDENHSLKQRQDVLTSERAHLLQKNEQVRARVEAMIGRLKAMEQSS
jgi:cell division protein ZapB